MEIWHRNIGSTTSNSIIIGSTAYIQPVDVFNLIRVRADITADKRSISGYYIEEVRPYKIDFAERMITYRDDKYPITKDEIIETASGTFLRCDVFEKVFQLKCTYYFNGLSVELQSGEPLPAESEAAAAKNRQHLQKYGEEFIPDRRFSLSRKIFSIGTLDYQGSGGYEQDGKILGSGYGLLFGGQLLGGDFDAALTGVRGGKVLLRNVPWQYRTGFEDKDLVSQIIIGKHAAFSNLSLPDSKIGMQITNAQTGYKSSFANYTISDRTEPNWTVELYINDVLITYAKADQTGYYKFVVPLSYGSTNVVLKFHGPYGEVRIQTVQLRIPYTFLPPGHLEYTATVGTSLDKPSINSSIGKADLKFGISTFMTSGGGLFYQHDADGKASYNPYLTSSLHVTSGILLAGEYYYGSGYRSSMNISGPNGLSLDAELDHPFRGGTNALTGQTINDLRKLLISTPMPFVNGSFRLSALEIPLNKDSGTVSLMAAELVSYLGISFNLSAEYALLRERFKFHQIGIDALGNAGLSMTILEGLLIHPSVSLDYSTRQVTDMQLVLTKSLSQFFTVNVTGTYSFISHSKALEAEMRMNLPFAQVGLTGSGGTGQRFQGNGSIQGSLGYDPNTGSFPYANTPEVRRGGVVVVPYLDRNNNGRRDPGEPIVQHVGFEQVQGRMTEDSSGILRIMDLEPYKKYVMKTSTDNVENISWTPKFSSFEVTPPANGYALVEIPMVVSGQFEGYVNEDNQPLGGARIKIRHHEKDDSSEVPLSLDLLTYSNGEFYYMGIAPGKYRAYIDPKQLEVLHYSCTPAYIDFELANKEEGDTKEGLNFLLKSTTAPGPSVSPTKASN